MSAFSSSATVSAFSPFLSPTDHPNRRCREEHHHHVSHQGSFRRTCTSSLQIVAALCSSDHPFQVQHVVPEVTIPPEVTPENVTTYIVDSGGRCYPPCSHPPSPSPTKPVHRTDNILNQRYEKHTSYVSCTLSTIQTPSTVYLHFGSRISVN